MGDHHRVGLRLLSVGALAACSIALVAILTSGLGSAPAVASAETRLTLVGERVAAVREELRALVPGRRAGRARRAVLAAVQARGSAVVWLGRVRRTGARLPASGERLANALDALHDWLDAVGSTLSNPHSPLRHRLTAAGRRVRAAFDSLPAETRLAGTVGGEERLLAFAASRR